MIVDASALVSLLLREPGWQRIADALAGHDHAAIGAPALTENVTVLQTKGAPASLLPALLQRTSTEVVAFTQHHATVAHPVGRCTGITRHGSTSAGL